MTGLIYSDDVGTQQPTEEGAPVHEPLSIPPVQAEATVHEPFAPEEVVQLDKEFGMCK